MVIHGNAHRLYYIHGLIPLVILTSHVLVGITINSINKFLGVFIIAVRYIFVAGIIFFTFLTALNYVVGIKVPCIPLLKQGFLSDAQFNSCSGFGKDGECYYSGSIVRPNWGIKTAGYFIREHALPEDKIFTELPTSVAKYYFHRKIFCASEFWHYFSGSIEEKLAYLKQVHSEISYIVLIAANANLLDQYLPGEFHPLVEVYSNGEKVLVIFSRSKASLQTMNTEEFDSLFDKKYGNWKELYAEDYIYHPGFF